MMSPLILCLVFVGGGEEARPPSKIDNKPCYVCHIDLMKEEISQVHIEEKVGCVTCHGPSMHHMHDEMLMTKPDILYGRSEVQAACRRCHDEHEHPDRVKRFLKRMYGKDRPNGRVINEHSICTDCHGTHNIVKEGYKPKGEAAEEKWVELFDGKALPPWKAQGGKWQIKRGRIVGLFPKDGQVSLSRPADMDCFRLYLTFRLTGKQRANFYLKGEQTKTIPLSGGGPHAAGSLLVDGKLTVLNPLPTAIDPEGWNTISLVSGEFIQVWLNAKEIYRLRQGGAKTLELGFNAVGEEEWASLEIGEIKFQPMKEKRINRGD